MHRATDLEDRVSMSAPAGLLHGIANGMLLSSAAWIAAAYIACLI